MSMPRDYLLPTHASTTESADTGATEPGSSELAALRAEVAMLRGQLNDVMALLTVRGLGAPDGSTIAILPTMASMQITQDMQGAFDAFDTPPTAEPGEAMPETPGATSRRTLLKWGGVGAAAALAAAGGAALTTPAARAADGDPITMGSQTNSADAGTAVNVTIASNASVIRGFVVDTGTSSIPTQGIVGRGSNNGLGVAGFAPGPLGIGVTGGTQTGIGVQGTTLGSGTAVLGTVEQEHGDATAIGVQGTAIEGTGVLGQSNSGFGVIATTQHGPALAVQGTGTLLQILSAGAGAPTNGSHQAGEQSRDSKGDLYLCIASGIPGTWRKVAAGIPGVSGATNFLPSPIRLLDTRTSGTWSAGSTHTLQVTGVAVGSISVPAGAVGVIGNVTVVNPSAGGDLRLYPGGASLPGTSSINFATGQVIANGVTVGLSVGGKISIKVDMPSNSHTHVLFDVSAYIL